MLRVFVDAQVLLEICICQAYLGSMPEYRRYLEEWHCPTVLSQAALPVLQHQADAFEMEGWLPWLGGPYLLEPAQVEHVA